MSRLALTLALSLTACSTGGSFQGHLVDGLTGEARGNVRVLARASDTTDLACQVVEATTDESGNFTLGNVCSGATYTLAADDETLLLADAPVLTGGEAQAAPVELTVFRAPQKGTGLYKLSEDGLTPLRTFADVATETVKGTDIKVRYPTLKPTRATDLQKGDWLVMAGKTMVDRLEIVPLVADDAVRGFEGDVTIENHVYIGTKFSSDTEFEKVEAQLDADGVRNITSGDQVVRFISQDALPEGRYAILGPQDKRTYVLDFGKVAAPATASNAE